jgi:multiple sugar transport system permease protein
MTNMAASVPTTHKKFHMSKLISAIALYVAIAIVCVMTLFPIYWMLVSTFQPNEYTLRYPPPLFPKEIIFTQFTELFNHHPIALWLRNSLLIASMAMLISTALSVLGAYALSSLRWKGRSTFGLFLLVTQMLPEILVLIPLYVIYRQFNMLNSIPALSLVDTAFVLPICIWILKGVFDTVPSEVLDAAVVDGCTELSAIWNIVLPLSTPGLVAVAVVSFFSAWNEYLYASILLGNAKFMPASVGLSTLKAIASTPVEQYMAAGLVFSILPVLFYLSMQRYIVSGLTAGAVKG